MNETQFRIHLLAEGTNKDEISQQIEIIKNLEIALQKHVPSWTLEDINAASTQTIVDEMIDRGENSIENFLVLLNFARAIGNNELFKSIYEILDGHEAMENLHMQLAERVGDDLRDIIFEGLSLPPIGLSKREKVRFTYRIMRRMVNVFEEQYCREMLSDSLRDLPDDYYINFRTDFYETCESDLDRYLELKREKFIETLKMHQVQGLLFYSQEVTDAVIDFVNNNSEIGGGIRSGNIIYEIKIPYNAKAYLDTQDPDEKRYSYCHCPWARESLRGNALKVPATFCQCSAGFHKKPWEVIFEKKLKAEVLESVLQGDDRCRFAIYLPKNIN